MQTVGISLPFEAYGRDQVAINAVSTFTYIGNVMFTVQQRDDHILLGMRVR
jgi:hypothetical protein